MYRSGFFFFEEAPERFESSPFHSHKSMNYRIETQLTIPLENAPGKIATLTQTLADKNINIHAISLSDRSAIGSVRFTSDSSEEATSVLENSGYQVTKENVLSISMEDSKGRLSDMANTLSRSGINIDYMYACVDPGESDLRMIMKVSNIPLATRVLDELVIAA